MDTGMYSYGNQNVQSAAQRKFYQWVLKWINGVPTHSDTNSGEIRDIRHLAKPDVQILASFLQAIGFKLLSFEKHNDAFAQKKIENSSASTSEQGIVRVTIECNISNMKAILELDDITCRCPNPDHIKDASFWSISGTGPTANIDNIVQKVEETGSNLLPPLSKDVTRVLRDVSYKLFDTITCEPDVNRNTDVSLNISYMNYTFHDPKFVQNTLKREVGVIRSYTQPEMRPRANSLNIKCFSEKKNTDIEPSPIRNVSPSKSVLQRQRTWDLDVEIQNLDEEPRPSYPKLISSPTVVAELSNSLGQISLQSDMENSTNITEYIIGAQQNLEKALKILLLNKPMIRNDLSPNLDQDTASVKSAPANISPTAVVNPYKSTRVNMIEDVKTKQNKLMHQRQSSTKIISGSVAQIPKARRSIEPILSKSMSRKNEQENSQSTVRRNSFYIPPSANHNISIVSKSETKHKLLGIGKYNISKTNTTIESDFSKRSPLTAKKVASPEPRIGTSSNLQTPNVSNERISLIKPPTKISKSIPVKVKSLQSTKINTGITRNSKANFSKE